MHIPDELRIPIPEKVLASGYSMKMPEELTKPLPETVEELIQENIHWRQTLARIYLAGSAGAGRWLQIIPAGPPKVEAVFDDGESYPVVAWVLVEDEFFDEQDGTTHSLRYVTGLLYASEGAILHTIDGLAGRFLHYHAR